jgi:hypothetical protein
MGRRSKFSEEQIIGAIREVEAGVRQIEVARRLGVRRIVRADSPADSPCG